MHPENNYLAINRTSWNNRTDVHLTSAFYDVANFLAGNNSLNPIELNLLGDVQGKSILHLQCHFGQDSISLSRMGANVTGIDFSDRAIARARELATQVGTNTRFIECNLYDLPQHLHETFDIVFTSYGTIGWLPDINAWANIVAQFLKPGGRFIMAEFHPVIWMYNNDLDAVTYRYFNSEPIVETENGTYAEPDAPMQETSITWNHGLAEVIQALLNEGLRLNAFHEYDYSPYNCFKHAVEEEPKKFRIQHFGNKIPMVYALEAVAIKK